MTTSTDVGGQRPRMPAATATPDRRAFLTLAACSLAHAATVTTASAATVDPVFAAIESHKAANGLWLRAVSAHTGLERTLPADRRRSSVTAWEDRIVPTDDPRWIEAERAVSQTSDAEVDAAADLLNVRPMSLASVMALLQYAVAHDASGEGWPCDLSDGTKSRSWHSFLIEMLAETLPDLLAARG